LSLRGAQRRSNLRVGIGLLYLGTNRRRFSDVDSYPDGHAIASAVGRRVRTRDLTREDGQLAFSNLDTWVARSAYPEEMGLLLAWESSISGAGA
jgi:hypothetical protein